MELEQKHILPYLQYGLKARLSREGRLNLDSEYPNEHQYKVGTITNFGFYDGELNGILKVTDNYSFDFDQQNEIEIILRQLSEFGDIDDTRKVHEFIGLGKWCDNYDDYFNAWFNDVRNIDKLILQAPQEIFNYFLANRFDVFGLITAGLAIDINTLQEETK